MEKVKVQDLSKVEKKIIELNCIQDLIKSANYSIERLNKRIDDYQVKKETETLDDYEIRDIRDLYESILCFRKLIDSFENLV